MKLAAIFVRYKQWLQLGLLMREALREDFDKVLFVGPPAFVRKLRATKALDETEIIHVLELSNVLCTERCSEFHLLVQHSLSGMRDFDVCREALGDVEAEQFLWFYPDGMTNNCEDTETVLAGAEKSSFQLGSDIAFDRIESTSGFCPITPRIRIIRHADYQQGQELTLANLEAQKLVDGLDLEDGVSVIVLILRPWEDEAFLDGKLRSLGAKFPVAAALVDLIYKYTENIGPCRLLIRPDDRGLASSLEIASDVQAQISDRMRVDVIDQAPWWMTFEPIFKVLLEEIGDRRVHVLGMDSTFSLPFLFQGRGAGHVFGVPSIKDEDGKMLPNRAILEKLFMLNARATGAASLWVRYEREPHFVAFRRRINA
ncbi:hypothetical protein HK107_10560 [Parvularcula sp. ZS-1/3]|uniref:Uncharacterized protein n=1 Tax=Parvularcula mediterranea TaxID=2732508 RepID=A0A7Y3W5Y6_9PROT|nr:hypothetical protein [Parvularcula mediterranea]NNU16761.1 hypothetical protein [Parvularcula mediterranea]